jgi:iron complex outermembrane recepter protein
MKKYFLLGMMILTFQSINWAQEPDRDTTYYQLDSVIVNAGRYEQPLYQIPFTTNIISQNILNLPKEGLSSEDIFQFVPGVIVNDRYNLSEGDRISLRGIGTRAQFGVRGIKILLDGIPLTFPDGQSQLNNLDLNSIGNIEVIQGSNSVLYGNSAGGVISIQSKNVNSTKLNANAGYSFGSFGYQNFLAEGSDRIGNNSVLISFNKMKLNGFRENSAASTNSLNIISTQYFNNGFTVEAIFNFYDAPYLLNPSSLSKSDAEDNPTMARQYVIMQGAGKKIQQRQAGVNISYQPDNNQKIDATIYSISRSMLNPLPGDVINLNLISGGFRTDYSDDFKLFNKGARWLSGGDYEFQNDLRKEYNNNGLSSYDYQNGSIEEIIDNVRLGNILIDQREKVNGYGIFSSLEFSPLENIFLTFGFRYDKYNFGVADYLKANGVDNSGSMNMGNLSKMLGATYRLTEDINLFANYSTSFQTPTTDELGNSPTKQGGFDTSLKPEQIRNIEIGARGDLLKQTLNYSVSTYNLNIDQILIPYQLPNSLSDVTYYRNSGGAINNGIELALSWIPDNQLNFSFSYAFMNFKFKNFIETEQVGNTTQSIQLDGKYVPGIPKHNFSLGMFYRFLFGLTADFSTTWNDKYFVNDVNGPEPGSSAPISDYINDAYLTANIKIDYSQLFSFGNMSFYFGVNNLFDTKYNGSIVPNAAGDRYFEPAAPRNWFCGLSINYK